MAWEPSSLYKKTLFFFAFSTSGLKIAKKEISEGSENVTKCTPNSISYPALLSDWKKLAWFQSYGAFLDPSSQTEWKSDVFENTSYWGATIIYFDTVLGLTLCGNLGPSPKDKKINFVGPTFFSGGVCRALVVPSSPLGSVSVSRDLAGFCEFLAFWGSSGDSMIIAHHLFGFRHWLVASQISRMLHKI